MSGNLFLLFDLARIFLFERPALVLWSSLFRQMSVCAELSIPFDLATRDWIQRNRDHFSVRERSIANRLLEHLESGGSFIDFVRYKSTELPKDVQDLLLLSPSDNFIPRVLPAAQHLLEQRKLRIRSIQRAILYPIQIFLILILIVTVYRWKVVPTFESLLASRGSSLPSSLHLLENFAHYFTVIKVVGVFFVATIIAFLIGPAKPYREQIFLRTPILGNQIFLNERVRLLISLSLLLDENRPRLVSLQTITIHLKTKSCRSEFQLFLEGLSKGNRWEESVQNLRFLTPDIQFILRVLPQSKINPAMLLQTSLEYYRGKKDQLLGISLVAIEPILLILIAVVVAFAVYAMYSPLVGLAPLIP